MRLMLIGTAGFAAFAVAFVRAKGEFARHAHLSVRTLIWQFVTFVTITVSVGLGILLLGTALLGRSGAALVLVALYTIACTVWIRMEEQVLQRRFGTEYVRYRANVPRFL